MIRIKVQLIIISLVFSAAAYAGTPVDTITSSLKNDAMIGNAPQKEASLYERFCDLAKLYENDSNPFIEEFTLRGRYHAHYHWLDSNQGEEDSWENRRLHLGFAAKLLNKKIGVRFTLQASNRENPFAVYNGFVDAFIKWIPSDTFSLTLGRQKPQIAYYDYVQSTNILPTFERTQMFNQLNVNRATGAVAEGKIGNFLYQAGAYSNDPDYEFGQFDAGMAYGAGIGYDLKHALNTQRTDLRLDWLHSNIETNTTVLNRYSDLFTATLWLEKDRYTLVTEAFYGTGKSPDILGFYVQPTYDLILKKLQLVGRYTFSSGDGSESVQAQSRYERRAPNLANNGKGDQYQAFYFGLQYFIHGNGLKLLAGAEYSSLRGGANGNNFQGWTYLTGIRFAFN